MRDTDAWVGAAAFPERPPGEQPTGRGRTKVLYIAGAGRSGSTLLGQILGQIEGFSFFGEVVYAWQAFGLFRCGCGAPLDGCEFWTAVRREVGGQARPLDPRETFGFARLARWRHLPSTLGAGAELPARLRGPWRRGERLYAALSELSGARVIVDSSKSPVYGRMLGQVPGVDVHVVHLVRDARAVAYSWRRLKPGPNRPDRLYMNRHPPFEVARFWVINNVGTELFCRRAPDRYLRLRYEDLVRRPIESVTRILDLLGERPAALPFSGERTVLLGPNHSVKGNPDRFRTGPVELTLDGEWQAAMRPADRRLVSAVTWPVLWRYGYLGSSPHRRDVHD